MSCEIYTLFDGAGDLISFETDFPEPIRFEVGDKPARFTMDLTWDQAVELYTALGAAIEHQKKR